MEKKALENILKVFQLVKNSEVSMVRLKSDLIELNKKLRENPDEYVSLIQQIKEKNILILQCFSNVMNTQKILIKEQVSLKKSKLLQTEIMQTINNLKGCHDSKNTCGNFDNLRA